MSYRAVGNRCAVDFDELQLPISYEEAEVILIKQGFKVVETDLMELAHGCLGTSQYRRSARLSEAPAVVDCSSFIKWLYGMCGIWLPRRTIQQRELGESITLDQMVAGDVVFFTGSVNYYHDDPSHGVGHVGIVTDDGKVIHAAGRKEGVIKQELDEFLGKRELRGVRRYIPQGRRIVTLETPPEREVEISSDLRWIILQLLPR